MIRTRMSAIMKVVRKLVMNLQGMRCVYPIQNFHSKEESRSLLERAGQCMKERFAEKLKVDGGSLCVWEEWLGRPHDNYHVVETVRWERKKNLVIGNAQEVFGVWYAYGRAVYENMYVRQYRKDANGIILRVEGKRIEANVIPRNKAALRALEKNHFRNKGISKYYTNINGVWEDHIHMVKIN